MGQKLGSVFHLRRRFSGHPPAPAALPASEAARWRAGILSLLRSARDAGFFANMHRRRGHSILRPHPTLRFGGRRTRSVVGVHDHGPGSGEESAIAGAARVPGFEGNVSQGAHGAATADREAGAGGAAISAMRTMREEKEGTDHSTWQ